MLLPLRQLPYPSVCMSLPCAMALALCVMCAFFCCCAQRKDHADTLSAALLADRPLAVRTSIASVLHTMIAGDTVSDWPLAAVRPVAPIHGLCHKRLH